MKVDFDNLRSITVTAYNKLVRTINQAEIDSNDRYEIAECLFELETLIHSITQCYMEGEFKALEDIKFVQPQTTTA